MESPRASVAELSRELGTPWGHLEAAQRLSNTKLEELRTALSEGDLGEAEDVSIVVLGSLARREFTDGSDIDWNLLVDGSSNPSHHQLARDVGARISRLAARPPGTEGAFGALVSSHSLVHHIGGEDDTNKNTTRRLLLLLESVPVGRGQAHHRVITNILARYLLADRSFWRGTTTDRHHIPHFLLNDFVRFWRTMTVDFAYKLWTRSGEGQAIRNIKLRMSRKLLFVAGLAACYRCHLDFSEDERRKRYGDEALRYQTIEYLRALFASTPLEIVAGLLLKYPHLKDASRRLFDAYDEFLGVLSDAAGRERLEKTSLDELTDDATYRQCQELSHQFRDALIEVFFDEKSALGLMTKLYGVF